MCACLPSAIPTSTPCVPLAVSANQVPTPPPSLTRFNSPSTVRSPPHDHRHQDPLYHCFALHALGSIALGPFRIRQQSLVPRLGCHPIHCGHCGTPSTGILLAGLFVSICSNPYSLVAHAHMLIALYVTCSSSHHGLLESAVMRDDCLLRIGISESGV